MIIKKREFGLELGIVLLILSIPISQITKLVFGFTTLDLSNILLIISLFLICNKSNMIRIKLPSINKEYLLILWFQLYNIIIAIFAGINLFEANYGLLYIIFTIALLLVFSTNSRKIESDMIIRLFVYISGIFNLLLLYYLTDRFTYMIPKNINIIYINNIMIADRLTLSIIAYFYIISLLVFHSKKRLDKFFSFIFLLAALLNIISTFRRGLMVALIFIIIIHLFYKLNKKSFNKNTIYRDFKFLLYFLAFVALLVVITTNIPELALKIESFKSSILNSLNTFFKGGKEISYDVAAYSRVLAREKSIDLFYQASVFRKIFGFGYMYEWIDFPFLQAIIDMGIIFGGIYIYIQIKPVLYGIMKLKTFKDGELLFLYFTIIGFLNNFYSGIPYGYYKYVYLIIFIYVIRSR